MDRNGVLISSVLEYKVYMKHKTCIEDLHKASFANEFNWGTNLELVCPVWKACCLLLYFHNVRHQKYNILLCR